MQLPLVETVLVPLVELLWNYHWYYTDNGL